MDRTTAPCPNPATTRPGGTTPEGGRTWVDAAIPLDGMAGVSAFAVPEGIVAITTGPRVDNPEGAWLSRDGTTWEPVTVEDAGIPDERAPPDRAAWSASRVVVVGNTVGTGAGGDRVVVWTYDRTGP